MKSKHVSVLHDDTLRLLHLVNNSNFKYLTPWATYVHLITILVTHNV